MYLGMEVHVYNPAPRRLKQENFGLEASLGYIARSCPPMKIIIMIARSNDIYV